ncbi:hypothetical protein KM043_001426 [Ampulex compressa]|nr:hypothetical protein KM043_001426 [Ampulex compressa]
MLTVWRAVRAVDRRWRAEESALKEEGASRDVAIRGNSRQFAGQAERRGQRRNDRGVGLGVRDKVSGLARFLRKAPISLPGQAKIMTSTREKPELQNGRN